jgi:hypothetical protein
LPEEFEQRCRRAFIFRFFIVTNRPTAATASRCRPRLIQLRLRAVLDLAAHDPCLVLELSAGALESIVHGKGQVGITFIRLGRTSNIDLATTGSVNRILTWY